MNSPAKFLEPVEAKFTKWHNPLDREQVVDIREAQGQPPTRYRWKPGETRELPSKYDNAIQRVHDGKIVAGKAPLLQRVGANDVLDPALDMFAAEKKQREAEQLAAAHAKKMADEAMLVAAAKVSEAEKKHTRTRGLPPDLAEKKQDG